MRTTILILLLLATMVFTGGADRTRRSVADRAKAKVAPELMIFAEPPTADFTATGSVNGRAPQTIDFTSTSANGPTSWSWDFGDGQTSTEQNPTHIFNTGTACNVSLTVSNEAGTDSETKTAFVDLLNPYWYPSSYTLNESSSRITPKNMVMPANGGTINGRLYNDTTNAQMGTDKSSAGPTYSFGGIVAADGTILRYEYWVSVAPAGYDAWGSSSNRKILLGAWEFMDGRGDTPMVPTEHP